MDGNEKAAQGIAPPFCLAVIRYLQAMRIRFAEVALLAFVLPAAAWAYTPPLPIAPEEWASPADWRCSSNGCGQGGTVRFVVTVAATGRVANCVIRESSGDPMFDQQTCRLLTLRARFEPARDDNGTPVEGRYEGQIRWAIPDRNSVRGGAAS